MSRNVQTSGGSRPVIWIACLLGAAMVGGAWYYQTSRRPAESVPPEEAVAASTKPSAAATKAAAEDSELRPMTPEEIANAPRPPAVIQSTGRVAAAAAPAPAVTRTPPTPYTQQLVANLQLDLTRGPITAEQAAQWKQGLKTLTEQGAAAVPAIREFLEKNLEFDYTAVKGGELLGQSSMRGAMLDALQQIGGPEAMDVMLQTLRSTTLPSEIARLAEYLEQQAPGQYRQETLNTINEVLTMASGRQLPGMDMAPLFPVLAKYGDPAALQQIQAQWKYYATLALAGLEGGQGIPALIQQVQTPAGSRNDFALQMLAQQASAYPEAKAALVEQARANQISESAWRRIATDLAAGDQFFIGTRPANAGIVPGMRTYHIESGNQNFYSQPVASTGGDPQTAQRLAVIDQLLAATPNAFARQALQQARDTLARTP